MFHFILRLYWYRYQVGNPSILKFAVFTWMSDHSKVEREFYETTTVKISGANKNNTCFKYVKKIFLELHIIFFKCSRLFKYLKPVAYLGRVRWER